MKKLTLLTCAFMATTMALAQENVALNKHVYPIGSTVTGVTEEGLQQLTDGNAENWYNLRNNTGGDNMGDDADNEGLRLQSWYIDLGNEVNISSIYITWEGAYAKKYKIDVTNTDPNESSTSWTNIVTEVDGASYTDQTSPKSSSHVVDIKARYVKFTPEVLFNDIWGCKMGEFYVYDKSTAVLAQFSIPSVAKFDAEGVVITPELKGNSGMTFTDPVSYEISPEAGIIDNGDGTITIKAANAGTYTITVKAGDVELIQEIVLLDVTAGTPTDNAEDVYAFFSTHYGAPTVDEVLPNTYFSRYNTAEIIALSDDDNVYYVTGAGSFGLRRGTPTTSDYKSLKFDIYAFEDIMGTVQLRNGKDVNGTVILEEQPIQLLGGQWNHIEISLDDALKEEAATEGEGQTVKTTIGYVVWTCQTKVYHNLLIGNVYLSKSEAKESEIGIIATKDENGYTLLGRANTAEELNEKMNDTEATFYDLTDLEFADGITTINPTNPNALILVKNEFVNTGNGDYTSAIASQLSGTDNVIVTDGNYYFPAKQLVITDGYPVYTKKMISTNTRGYQYTRKIGAGKVVTTYLPAAVSELPDGLYAYKISAESGNTITFTKQTDIAAETPYILYAEKDVDFVVESADDLNLTAEHDGKTDGAANGNITFHGNYETKAGTGNEYGLQGATDLNDITFRKVESGATIGAFRAYFTIAEGSDAKSIRFSFNNGDGTTAISSIDTEVITKLFNVYSLDGKIVRRDAESLINLPKGIYIVNGKKMVIK